MIDTPTIVAIVTGVLLVVCFVAWLLTHNKLVRRDADARLSEQLREREKELREQEKAVYEDSLRKMKEGQEKAIEAARTALALENEKLMKQREEALKKEAAETMKIITGDLDRDIRTMKEAFDAFNMEFNKYASKAARNYLKTLGYY